LGGRVVGPALAYDIVRSWLTARYIGTGRHKRRVDQILEIERSETERKDTG
jgi:ribose 5-phosphate isomerase B